MPATIGEAKMAEQSDYRRARNLRGRTAFVLALPFALGGCATLGSLLSPYSEKFSCKNSDHGQCVHPEQAWNDAVAGRAPRSDPAVTRVRKLLGAAPNSGRQVSDARTAATPAKPARDRQAPVPAVPRASFGETAAIDSPASPMLKPSRTIRTLILPYADRQRPDRLYMPRFVYSILGRPTWVVGDYLVEPVGRAPNPPVLRTARDTGATSTEISADASPPALTVDHAATDNAREAIRDADVPTAPSPATPNAPNADHSDAGPEPRS